MMTFSCGGVSPGCAAQFRARREDELYEQIARHAVSEHASSAMEDWWLEAVRQSIMSRD